MSLLKPRLWYKPFEYPLAFELYLKQQHVHWLPEEVSMADDVKDWRVTLSAEEKHLLTQVFRFFVQADVEVSNCYLTNYLGLFKPVEIRMMLTSFANIECVHIHAYSYLLDSLAIPETEYQVFLEYKEMRDKWEYLQQFNMNDNRSIAITLAVFGGFIEGLALFASFILLLNFQRFGKMKGMCQIVAWSIRDETLHTHALAWLFRLFVAETRCLDRSLAEEIRDHCKSVVTHEDAFVDLAFGAGEIKGLTSYEVKRYIRYIADYRLEVLGLEPIFGIGTNPLPWFDEIVSAPEFMNFFDNRVTEYSKGATKGNWDFFD
jgi:ribonucleoside-diphosphate reductase beta chain